MAEFYFLGGKGSLPCLVEGFISELMSDLMSDSEHSGTSAIFASPVWQEMK